MSAISVRESPADDGPMGLAGGEPTILPGGEQLPRRTRGGLDDTVGSKVVASPGRQRGACRSNRRRAPALPAQLVRVVVCAVRGPSPANRSAPQIWGRLGGGRLDPLQWSSGRRSATPAENVEEAPPEMVVQSRGLRDK